ncbi:MAG: Dabb family protein [Myxococcota bacterium]
MIERIVLFKLKDAYANDAARSEIAERSRKDLSALPQVKSVTVGVPGDAQALESWDISLVVRLESLDDFAEYVDHPDHRAYVDDYMSERIEVRKAWNFRID